MMRVWAVASLVVLTLPCWAFTVEEDKTWAKWLDQGKQETAAAKSSEKEAVPAPAEAAGAAPQAKGCPFGVVIEYSLMSDFICRKGLNLSEYPGEGREKLNHQLLVVPSFSTKDVLGKGTDLGTFSVPAWLEWYAGQQHLTPWDGSDFQEGDFMPTWTYAIPKTPLTFSFTWDGIILPRLKHLSGGGDISFGQEVWFGLALDDSAIFGKRILSPFMTYVLDVDDNRGSWLDLGVQHDFALGDLACLRDVPILRHTTLNARVVLGVDHRYVDKIVGNDPATHFSTINYGLSATTDLNAVLGIPKTCGSLYVRTSLNFKEQLHDYNVAGPYPVLRDELYGGVTVGYAW